MSSLCVRRRNIKGDRPERSNVAVSKYSRLASTRLCLSRRLADPLSTKTHLNCQITHYSSECWNMIVLYSSLKFSFIIPPLYLLHIALQHNLLYNISHPDSGSMRETNTLGDSATSHFTSVPRLRHKLSSLVSDPVLQSASRCD